MRGVDTEFFEFLKANTEFIGCIKVRKNNTQKIEFVTAYLTTKGWSLDKRNIVIMDAQQALQFKVRGGDRVWVEAYQDPLFVVPKLDALQLPNKLK